MGPDLPFSQQCIGTRRGRSAKRRRRPSAGWRPMSSSRHSTEPGTGALYGTGYRGTLRSQLKGALRSQVLYSELYGARNRDTLRSQVKWHSTEPGTVLRSQVRRHSTEPGAETLNKVRYWDTLRSQVQGHSTEPGTGPLYIRSQVQRAQRSQVQIHSTRSDTETLYGARYRDTLRSQWTETLYGARFSRTGTLYRDRHRKIILTRGVTLYEAKNRDTLRSQKQRQSTGPGTGYRGYRDSLRRDTLRVRFWDTLGGKVQRYSTGSDTVLKHGGGLLLRHTTGSDTGSDT